KTFESLSDAQIEVRLQKAADTFLSYRRVPFAERAQKMLKAAAILDGEKETFAKMMTTEMGKTFRSAVDEAAKCAWVCRYYAENAERFLADEIVETTASRSYIRYQPLGAVLAVMPWNFPFWQVLRFAAPALMAGNVGLLKHASIVPQCALAIEGVFRRETPSIANAHCGTIDACFRRPTFPAINAGAANRSTCQNGKFQGMTARTAPSGWYRM